MELGTASDPKRTLVQSAPCNRRRYVQFRVTVVEAPPMVWLPWVLTAMLSSLVASGLWIVTGSTISLAVVEAGCSRSAQAHPRAYRRRWSCRII